MALSLPEAARQKLQGTRGRPTSSHFILSLPGSESTSRESSPVPSLKRTGYQVPITDLGDPLDDESIPGRLPTDVYDATLPRWRAAVRRRIVKSVQWESQVIARLQIEPTWSLAIGTHHLEYGFPSTHSTNSVSIALFFFSHVHRLASVPPSSLSEPVISAHTYTLLTIILSTYVFSIVFGRIYTAMHSFTDCAVGTILGSLIWWGESSWAGIPIVVTSSNPLYWIYTLIWPASGSNSHLLHLGRGLGGGQWVEEWVRRGGWEVPFILVTLCLLAINQHPQPVDDCPCFEDAIAFGSVVLGALVGSWAMSFFGLRMDIGKSVVMPGSGWVLEMDQWVQVERKIWDILIWWCFAALKMSMGILVIFVWRLLAKSALHLILPPTFRGLARVFELPNRRFYTPATDYKSVPSEFSGNGIHPIPSVIDLPSSAQVSIEVGGIGSGVSGVSQRRLGTNEIKMRGGGLNEKENFGQECGVGAVAVPELAEGEKIKDVKHYDAEGDLPMSWICVGKYSCRFILSVLTKVVVYAGIAVLACEVLPAMFEVFGWGVCSSFVNTGELCRGL
ncbi:hypothetical protein C0993_010127 [Termitomyces sp. T159_Od127]|nr:hypothetical protein C0993_010127 [Termitomyces sp. T159_Od127]